MAFCPSCGAQVTGGFCGACGAAVGSAPSPAPAPAPAPTAAAGIQDNVAGALCYLAGLVTGVIFLVLEPYNRKREIRFHAFQSIFLNVAWVVVWIALTIVGAIIPLLGPIVAAGLGMVMSLGGLAVWIIMMVKTFNGGKIVLPVIGPMAEKQAG